jgi:hypothetical protein
MKHQCKRRGAVVTIHFTAPMTVRIIPTAEESAARTTLATADPAERWSPGLPRSLPTRPGERPSKPPPWRSTWPSN